MINIDSIYELLADKGFQDPNTGNLFFPAYIYTYDPKDEYEARESIKLLNNKLKRPNHFLDSMLINIYEEILNYLKDSVFAGKSLFDEAMELEKDKGFDAALDMIRSEFDEGDFFHYLDKKVKSHFTDPSDKRIYLIIHGFGNAFPYLRASEFLKNTESWVKDFKLIVFYPGEYENKNYSLFGFLNDDNMYRANHLNSILDN